MPKIQAPKRIRIEDFKATDQALVSKIAESVNSYNDDTYNLLTGQLDFSNLNRQLTDVSLTLTSAGKLTDTVQVKLTISGKPRGVVVVAATNLVDSTVYPTSAPFCTWGLSNDTKFLLISNVSGLQAGSQYKLTLEIMA